MDTFDPQAERSAIAGALMHPKRFFNPHDLLWGRDATSLTSEEDLPDWASSDWLRSAPTVVRREKVTDLDYIPVGLRGATREQRHMTYLRRDRVVRWVTPEMLSQAAILDNALRFGQFAAIDTLLKIARRLDALNLAWGPTGSVGFTLASGILAMRPSSDLDLVVRAPEMLDACTVKALCAMDSLASCRLDIQIDTGHGAFSIAEWAQGKRRVLLKTDSGPLLTRAPWCDGKRVTERPA